jgi:hypothetical protein
MTDPADAGVARRQSTHSTKWERIVLQQSYRSSPPVWVERSVDAAAWNIAAADQMSVFGLRAL